MALKARQLQLVDAMIANPMMSDVKLAEQLGINNKTVGVWRKLPEFQEELKKRLAEKWKSAERLAVGQMLHLAEEGDFRANKYILDSLGYAPAQKVEAKVDATAQVVIVDDLGDESHDRDSK